MNITFSKEEKKHIKAIRGHFDDITTSRQAIRKAIKSLIPNDTLITNYKGANVNYKRHLQHIQLFNETVSQFNPKEINTIIPMPSDSQLIKERNEYVTKIYNQLTQEGYTRKAICSKMPSYGIFLKPRTIYAIISGEYDRPKSK